MERIQPQQRPAELPNNTLVSIENTRVAVDPWAGRNKTKSGREQAENEQKDKRMTEEAIKKGRISREDAINRGLLPKPRENIGYPMPKPFWKP